MSESQSNNIYDKILLVIIILKVITPSYHKLCTKIRLIAKLKIIKLSLIFQFISFFKLLQAAKKAIASFSKSRAIFENLFAQVNSEQNTIMRIHRVMRAQWSPKKVKSSSLKQVAKRASAMTLEATMKNLQPNWAANPATVI